MALLGGGVGGAGNPVGGSFTGPAEALEIIGDHAYAYSGSVDVSSETTLLDFKTGNYYFVGDVYFQGDYGSIGNEVIELQLKLNGTLIMFNKERRDLGQGTDQPFGIIIPPYTEVEGILNGSTTTNFNLNMVGRIYRTRD